MTAQSTLKQSELVSFDAVAAGQQVLICSTLQRTVSPLYSDGVLADPTGTLLIKPCTAAEVAFYETSMAEHPDFAEYIPTFMGTLRLAPAQLHAATADAAGPVQLATTGLGTMDGYSDLCIVANPESEPKSVTTASLPPIAPASPKGKKLDTELAIVLENVAAGFQKPNIMDVKLGARLWADDARPEKKAKLDKMASETTSGSLGFRIAGMRVWHGDGVGYRVYDKTYGRSLGTENVIEGFQKFFFPDVFAGNPRHDLRELVLRNITEELGEIQQLLKSNESRIYSASLLFVYEGDPESLEKAMTVEPSTELDRKGNDEEEHDHPADDDSDDSDDVEMPNSHALKLIDFAHASWTPGLGPDTNMLQGVENVAKILHELKPPSCNHEDQGCQAGSGALDTVAHNGCSDPAHKMPP